MASHSLGRHLSSRRRRGGARTVRRPASQPLFTSEDCAFLAVGTYPNMQRHVSNLQSVQISGMNIFSSFLTPSTSAITYAATAFSITGFGSTAIMGALSVFDQYRIDLIEVWMVSRDPTGVNNTNPGLVTSAVDLDDSNVPTSFPAVQSYGSSLTSSGTAGHFHRWRPHAALAAYSGAFTSYANEQSPWIDSGSPGVLHYGLKVASQPVAQATAVFDLIIRLTCTFRSSF
jgi:hypothetical protein